MKYLDPPGGTPIPYSLFPIPYLTNELSGLKLGTLECSNSNVIAPNCIKDRHRDRESPTFVGYQLLDRAVMIGSKNNHSIKITSQLTIPTLLNSSRWQLKTIEPSREPMLTNYIN